jgi:hypothetical protein
VLDPGFYILNSMTRSPKLADAVIAGPFRSYAEAELDRRPLDNADAFVISRILLVEGSRCAVRIDTAVA